MGTVGRWLVTRQYGVRMVLIDKSLRGKPLGICKIYINRLPKGSLPITQGLARNRLAGIGRNTYNRAPPFFYSLT